MKRLFDFITLVFMDFFLWILSFVIKRNDKYIAIGSWNGERYADNSRYLAEYISRNLEEYTIFWVGDNKIREEVCKSLRNVVFLDKKNFITNVKLLKCKYMFFSQMHTADISRFFVYRKAIMCYLHHGMPIKKWGQDGLNQGIKTGNVIKKIWYSLNGAYKEYDFFVTSSPLHDKTNLSALSLHGCSSSKNIHSGTPRNDIYFNVMDKSIMQLKKVYSQLLHFNCKSRVMIYLPTYRRVSNEVFSFTSLSEEDNEKLQEILNKYDAIIIEKSHVAEKHKSSISKLERVIVADSKLNVQEMMLFSDYLISDYSGAFLDYLLLDRPIIHYAYDYEYYKNVDSGLYYDISDFYAGPIANNFDELLIEIEKAFNGEDHMKERRNYVRKKYMTYEIGKASEQIVKRVMNI